MNLTLGKSLQNGKYVLNALLESGELDITYQASHTYLNQAVWIKTLNPTLSRQINLSSLHPQFIAEAGRISQCQHPNLARVLDYFQEEGTVFVVLEAIAGQSLRDLVQQSGPLPENQAIHYIRQAGLALCILHQQGILHGQISPQSLIRRQHSESILLTHFGLAREGLRTTPAYSHTLPSGYAAPEQYQSQANITVATDLYALAATLYFLVTGQSPVAAPLRSQISLPSLQQLRPQISPGFEQAVLRGLSMEPAGRPTTVEAWLSWLLAPSVLADSPPRQGYYTTLSAQTPLQVTLPKTKPDQPAGQPTGASLPMLPQPTVAAGSKPTHGTVGSDPATAMTIPLPGNRFQRRLKVLLVTGAIAAVVGAGIGFAIRFGLGGGSQSPLFHTEQSFPPRSDWPGSVPTEESSTPPTERSIPRSYPAPSYSAPAPYRSPAAIPKSPTNPTAQPPAPSPVPVNPAPAAPPVASPLPSSTADPSPATAVDSPATPTPAAGTQPPAPLPSPKTTPPPLPPINP